MRKISTVIPVILGVYLLLGSLFAPRPALAYPELVRYGYVNCTSCHVAPTGGGILNAYGREASKEVLSTWARDGEQYFAYSAVKPPEWLLLQGYYRSVYVYRDTPTFRDGRFIFMQGDLEAAAQYKNWTLDASAGYQDPAGATSFSDHLISRRHYLMVRTDDGTYGLRGGRFLPEYGIMAPDHITLTRRVLLLNDEDGETYNLEASYIGDSYNFYLTGVFGRPSSPGLDTGLTATASRAVSDRYKLGVSYRYGSNNLEKRNILGPWGILGFSHDLFLLTEIDFKSSLPEPLESRAAWGWADSMRLDHEWVQGFHTYLLQEFARTDFSSEQTQMQDYGLGLQWFPRPHFEFRVEWQKRQLISQSRDFQDYAYLLTHFYL